MQLKRYVPRLAGSTARSAALLALGLTAGLTACSSGAPAGDLTVDSKAGPAVATAPPGRYRTLFEPCGAVPQATLKELLPGAAELPEAERDKAYQGVAAVTYDTDRRVGCAWKADTLELSHRLSLDIERVVSYDATVSDDDRAQEVYLRKQLAAGIPLPPTAPPATTDASATGATPTGSSSPSGQPATGVTPSSTAPSADVPSADPTATTTATGLEPRVLEGLGDVAYVDDVLSTVGTSRQQRLVHVVFRTSNVLVTVSYQEQTTGSAGAPDSQELQERARNLARKLAERLEE
ncbi:DUF3558 domain-containing protein [Streptomyces sp. NPDC058872]|uniref:DUF3558 domain-containing protein n=1 Tax=Streptomyces sp. NPDC058872 TaxID=3346661 RepID=UPI0036833F1B